MIIKVPLYFDITGVAQEELPTFVAELTDLCYNSIRKDKISTIQFSQRFRVRALKDATLKVISREKAIEHLRTSS